MKWINIFLFVPVILISCNKNYVKSIYPIPDKQLFNKQLRYKDDYGYITILKDTVINKGKLRRIYNNGILRYIGKIDKNKPVGYWFEFKDSLELEYIFKYNGNKIDSFYHPFSIIQQRW